MTSLKPRDQTSVQFVHADQLAMGNCCNPDEKESSGADPAGERTTLLQNPAASQSDQEFDGPSTSNARSDEQSALSRILHQTATNVVDVSAMSPHSVEQQEYMDRSRQYRSRVSSLGVSGYFGPPVRLPDTGLSPYDVLSKPPVSSGDIRFVRDAAAKVSGAVGEVEVRQTEPLVVPFGVN